MAAPRRKSAQWWLGEIDAACKRDKDYLTEGRRVIDIYSGRKKDLIPFNILFSNTETYLPAFYSAVPRPVVDRRYKDADPIGKAAAEAGERGLAFLLDTDLEGYETFDEAMNCAVLDALLPGRGVTAIEYDAKLKKVEGYGAAAAAAPEKARISNWRRAMTRVVSLFLPTWSTDRIRRKSDAAPPPETPLVLVGREGRLASAAATYGVQPQKPDHSGSVDRTALQRFQKPCDAWSESKSLGC
jgi:hypothetical protein